MIHRELLLDCMECRICRLMLVYGSFGWCRELWPMQLLMIKKVGVRGTRCLHQGHLLMQSLSDYLCYILKAFLGNMQSIPELCTTVCEGTTFPVPTLCVAFKSCCSNIITNNMQTSVEAISNWKFAIAAQSYSLMNAVSSPVEKMHMTGWLFCLCPGYLPLAPRSTYFLAYHAPTVHDNANWHICLMLPFIALRQNVTK